MSLSINESIDTHFQCKGNWMTYPHFVIPQKPMKLNEKLGYCSVCWINESKENQFSSNPEIQKHTKTFKDSKINNNYFNQCGADTL